MKTIGQTRWKRETGKQIGKQLGHKRNKLEKATYLGKTCKQVGETFKKKKISEHCLKGGILLPLPFFFFVVFVFLCVPALLPMLKLLFTLFVRCSSSQAFVFPALRVLRALRV